MRHFVYEIDERNLRVKLKDVELPLKEGAWENFEEYSNKHKKHSAEDGANFKFSFNRNVILLLVFGLVIVFFSFLLYNFVSIKNPKAAVVPKPEENKVVAEPVQKVMPEPAVKIVQAAIKDTIMVKDTVAVKKEGIAETKVVVPEPVVEKEAPKVVAEAKKAEREDPEAEAKKAEELKKKQEKRAAAALARKIKPAVVTEDTDPDVRPN